MATTSNQIKEFNLLQLLSYANQEENNFEFDFSAIPIDVYDSIFKGLITHSVKNISRLGFNFDTLHEVEMKMQKSKNRSSPTKYLQHPPLKFESSIQQNRANIESELIGLASRILPFTESLVYFSLRHIPLLFPDIDVLSQSLYQCGSLRSLIIEDVPIKDKGFARLSQALQRRSIISLRLRNCGLTDNISKNLLDLIQYQTKVQFEAQKRAEFEHRHCEIVSIADYDLRENYFTSEFVTSIQQQVDVSPIIRFDLRGNSQISMECVHSPKIFVGPISYEEILNTSPSKKTQQGSRTYQRKLEEENAALHAELNRLTQGNSVAVLSTDLFAIGPRAPKLAEHLNQLDAFCDELQKENFSITSSSTNRSEFSTH